MEIGSTIATNDDEVQVECRIMMSRAVLPKELQTLAEFQVDFGWLYTRLVSRMRRYRLVNIQYSMLPFNSIMIFGIHTELKYRNNYTQDNP